jgi:hypothetical protein
MNFQNPEIAQIMAFPGNNTCVECLAPNPTYTSINNAVFLCENCANIHKALGPNISLVKSLNEQFSPAEINILRIGGNQRFHNLIGEYGITSDQSKEFKYHLKLVDYYRKLLLAELNKETNPNDYQMMLNNKPNPEIGLQIMENVTAESINQAQQSQSEIYKDASSLASSIGGFFSNLTTAINDTIHKYGIDEKINTVKDKITEEAKNFGESHPSVSSAANTAVETIKTVGNAAAEAANKIMNSEPVKNISQKVNEKYQEVMNSETVKNLSKKAEENYIKLKQTAAEKFGSHPPQSQ